MSRSLPRSPAARALFLLLPALLAAAPALATPVTYTVTLSGDETTSWVTGCGAQVFWPSTCPAGWDSIPPDTTGLTLFLPLAGSYQVTVDGELGTATLVDLGVVAAPGTEFEEPLGMLTNLTGTPTAEGADFTILDPGPFDLGFALLRFSRVGSTAVLTGHYRGGGFHDPIFLVRLEGTAVPEPSALPLLAVGVLPLARARGGRSA